MNVLFTPRATVRYSAWQTYRRLTATPVVLVLLLGVVTTAATWLVWAGLHGTFGPLLGLALLVSSATAGVTVLFVFAVTYFPAEIPSSPATQLWQRAQTGEVVEAAEAASHGLLAVLGSYASAAPETLPAAVTALLAAPPVRQLLARLPLDAEVLQRHLQEALLPTLTWADWSERMLGVAASLEEPAIELEHALGALLLHPTFKPSLRQYDLQERDIATVLWWRAIERRAFLARHRWWAPERLLNFTGVGLSWTAGFTPLVDRLVHFPAGNLWDQIILGREQYVDRLITSLARERQSNVLLVGQPGVGRLGVVREMARRVAAGTAHPALFGARVVYLHLGNIVAQGSSTASQLAVMSAALNQMERAGNIIAVIDGLESLIDGGENDMMGAIVPFFAARGVRTVVILSLEAYHLQFKANAELEHLFEVVLVESTAPEVTLQILLLAAPTLEQRTGVQLPYKTLRTAIEDTESILPHIPLPERVFDIVEEALVLAAARGLTIMDPALVDEVITEKVGVPVGHLRVGERERLLNLEALMHERVVNQTQAVSAVARAMIRARTGVRSTARPIGTFLFLGPTGVGKTETAKTLAHVYFGSADAMVRLDMSEFQTPAAVDQLIGSATIAAGRLTAAVADTPFSVVLLDEFEKAHVAVQQLFLQVLDEGHLTNARGHRVSFKHTVLIATSNAGAEVIRQAVQAGTPSAQLEEQLREHILQQGIFRPELLNRFDGVITFTPLSPAHVGEIARLMLQQLNTRLDAAHGVTIAVTPELVQFLVEVGYDPEFGARPMARAIQSSVEDAVARLILNGATTPGTEIVLSPEQLRASTTPGQRR